MSCFLVNLGTWPETSLTSTNSPVRQVGVTPQALGDVRIDLVAAVLLPYRDLNGLRAGRQHGAAPERGRLTLPIGIVLRLRRQQEQTIGTVLPFRTIGALRGLGRQQRTQLVIELAIDRLMRDRPEKYLRPVLSSPRNSAKPYSSPVVGTVKRPSYTGLLSPGRLSLLILVVKLPLSLMIVAFHNRGKRVRATSQGQRSCLLLHHY